jgi:hypothetical protein
LVYNYLPILLIALPAIIFIYLIITRPHLLLVDNYFFRKKKSGYTIDQSYNLQKKAEQADVDKILEKIHRKGMSSLSTKEKAILEEYSKR